MKTPITKNRKNTNQLFKRFRLFKIFRTSAVLAAFLFALTFAFHCSGESGDEGSGEPPIAASAVSAGGGHTCAIVNDGLKCWGTVLGNGSTSDSSIPVDVPDLSSGVTAISAGEFHTCAIHHGKALCWGDGSYGRLGNGGTSDSSTLVDVTGLSSGVTAISAGDQHTCAIHNGAAKCWGYNYYGRLGNGGTSDSSTPVDVTGLSSGVTAISAGRWHTCAIQNGAAKCWGYGPSGQLGNGKDEVTESDVSYFETTPVDVMGLSSGVTAISAGLNHTCAVVNDGVECWGRADPVSQLGVSQLGNGGTSDSSTPVDVTGLSSGVTTLDAGWYHTCAIHNGAAKCWGTNSSVQLGNGVLSAGSSTPVDVTGLSSGVTAISAGGQHTCAIVNDGVECWGSNYNGQLGNGNTSSSSIPVVIEFPDSANSCTTITAQRSIEVLNNSSAWAFAILNMATNDDFVVTGVYISMNSSNPGTNQVSGSPINLNANTSIGPIGSCSGSTTWYYRIDFASASPITGSLDPNCDTRYVSTLQCN